jgi:hypothetical protein
MRRAVLFAAILGFLAGSGHAHAGRGAAPAKAVRAKQGQSATPARTRTGQRANNPLARKPQSTKAARAKQGRLARPPKVKLISDRATIAAVKMDLGSEHGPDSTVTLIGPPVPDQPWTAVGPKGQKSAGTVNRRVLKRRPREASDRVNMTLVPLNPIDIYSGSGDLQTVSGGHVSPP